MSFKFTPAVRDRVPLLISVTGGTGSGKTMSGLKIARGLAGGDDSKIGVLDTETGRAKHYAPPPGEKPGPFRFGFMHGDLQPPFSPEHYLEAILEADKAGFEVIMVDSFSHVWAGTGGVSEIQEEALAAMVERARKAHEREARNYEFDEDKVRERLSMAAWKDAKIRHKRLVAKLLQCRAHLVICMRAEEKMKMEQVKQDNGYKKTVITPAADRPINERWEPVCERRFPFELTLSLLFVASKPGFPIPLKLEEEHRFAVPLDRPITEETGRLLAEWARGGAKKAPSQMPPPSQLENKVAGPTPPAPPVAPDQPPPTGASMEQPDAAAKRKSLEAAGAAAAKQGMTALRTWYTSLSKEDQADLRKQLDTVWKPEADKVK